MEEASQSNVNFVPCVRWVRRGVASANPVKVQLSKDELVQIVKDTKEKLLITANGNDDTPMEEEPSGSDEYNFENYDEDDEGNTASLLGISSLAELPTEAEDNFSESDDSEKEDDIIKPSDNLILVGHVEGDASILEVYVYNEEEESFYVHHDIILPFFPLCLEWLNYEPNMPNDKYQKRRKHIGHTDAVLALSWNRIYDHVIASGSVDQSILLWDMEKKIPNTTINVFNEKVQCLEWHRLEAQTLLAARVFDCRIPEVHQTWSLDGEAERLIWNPHQPFMFLAGTSKGSVQCFDCRKAHSKEVTGLAISGQCPGLLVTASPDETVKTWDFWSNSPASISKSPAAVNASPASVSVCTDISATAAHQDSDDHS
ncbi:hypothetical protein NQ314_011574 [Rhamnusium bicolor]|uniref:Uncharacterized protein n=1 Tax=Rhamnusium bicolor TaxID=1586634 RepID=A0AAV8XHC0_9CUCU|nr:hypothetical protein NQ314_011574 [Rhamnusium bicolor]